jgi:hypothetical protein
MPTTQEIANDLVALCRAGQFDAPGEKYFADGIVSLEPMDGEMARLEGKQAVKGKGDWWAGNHEVHGVQVDGPYVHGDRFIVRYKMDVTPKDGQRHTMDETGLYTVRDGKIVEEQFFYGA